MRKNYIAYAAIFGGLAVAIGAFGAHGLEKITKDPAVLHGFQTGVQYQMYHALALLGIAILFEKFAEAKLKWAATCFIAGIILFSGSLYLLTFLKLQGSTAVKFVGPITPIGGVLFIAGWLFLLLAATKRK